MRFSGSRLLVEGGGWHESSGRIVVEGDGAMLKDGQRRVVSGHGHPADGGFFEQAAGDLDRILRTRLTLWSSLGTLDPQLMRAEAVGCFDGIVHVEGFFQALGCAGAKARQVLLSDDLPETVVGQHHLDDYRGRRTVARGDPHLNAGEALLFRVIGCSLGGLLLNVGEAGAGVDHVPVGRQGVAESKLVGIGVRSRRAGVDRRRLCERKGGEKQERRETGRAFHGGKSTTRDA